MAFVVHWPNTYCEQWNGRLMKAPSEEFRAKIGSLTPVLYLQRDVIFPNAMAGVQVPMEEVRFGTPIAPGCVGNQVDNEFPLAPRLPVTLPMIQYPTNTRGPTWQEQDMCALPVLNWETYVKKFQGACGNFLGVICPKRPK